MAKVLSRRPITRREVPPGVMTIRQAAVELAPCHRQCDICPTKGHHWMLGGDLDEEEMAEDEDRVLISCKHCPASMWADINDPHLPQI